MTTFTRHPAPVRALPVLLLFATACSPGAETLDPCKDAAQTAERFATDSQRLTADAAMVQVPAPQFSADAVFPVNEDERRTAEDLKATKEREARQSWRLALRVVVDNPDCFSAEQRARARDQLGDS